MKFEIALAARLDIIRPSIENFAVVAPLFRLTPGVSSLVAALQARGTAVFLVSGGFRLMIEPVAAALNIPFHRIYANTIFFESDGSYKVGNYVKVACCFRELMYRTWCL